MSFLKRPKVEMPKLQPLPTENAEEVKARARKAMLEMRERRGGSSTILTDRENNAAPATRKFGRARTTAAAA